MEKEEGEEKETPVPPYEKISPNIYVSIMLYSLQIDLFLLLVSVGPPRDIMR
jgi:hypothetical protein